MGELPSIVKKVRAVFRRVSKGARGPMGGKGAKWLSIGGGNR